MQIPKQRIVLITTAQPSTNPRLVKEADALCNEGHEVTVIYCYVIGWAVQSDKEILKHVKWKYRMVGGNPVSGRIQFHFTRLRRRLAEKLGDFLGNGMLMAERAMARSFDEMLTAAKNIKADWYIGHNPGALAVCVKAAGKNQAKAGFDFEDYHRGELIPQQQKELQRIVYLEEKYVPLLRYITAASPLIAKAVEHDFPKLGVPVISVLNAFSKKEQPPFRELAASEKLKLFWFSQTIGKGRGLEQVFKALKKLKDPDVSLTLVGRIDEAMKPFIEDAGLNIPGGLTLLGTVAPGEIPEIAARHDVGLALEPVVPYNRDIALTNKIFTYLLAGNAIIFSKTKMQAMFNESFTAGIMVNVNEISELAAAISFYRDREVLNKKRLQNYQSAKKELNWENEVLKLVQYFNQQQISSELA